MIPIEYKGLVDPILWDILERIDSGGSHDDLHRYFDELKAVDEWHAAGGTAAESKYYRVWANTLAPKLIPALLEAIKAGKPPELDVTLDELDRVRQDLGIDSFGSPQDVLYAFTSDRYPNWGRTLHLPGFKSAAMIQQQRATVTVAPRFLDSTTPDVELVELPGAISADFKETNRYLFSEPNFGRQYEEFCRYCALEPIVAGENPAEVIGLVEAQLRSFDPRSKREEIDRQILLQEVEAFRPRATSARVIRNWLTPRPREARRTSQEQLVQKYAAEGNYLQKLLLGERVEHIQSNVKMVPNRLRGNKVEVDAIYRVVGRNKIVLLEAKGKDKISRAQLYGVYETFRGRMPLDWEIEIVAAMLTEPTQAQIDQGIEACIDLVLVDMNEAMLPNTVTGRLLEVRPKRAYRWLIQGQAS